MAKTATFAATHFTVAFGVAYALTGDIGVSGALALVEPACNTVAYYFHEKAWMRFGRTGTGDGGRDSGDSAGHCGLHHA